MCLIAHKCFGKEVIFYIFIIDNEIISKTLVKTTKAYYQLGVLYFGSSVCLLTWFVGGLVGFSSSSSFFLLGPFIRVS